MCGNYEWVRNFLDNSENEDVCWLSLRICMIIRWRQQLNCHVRSLLQMIFFFRQIENRDKSKVNAHTWYSIVVISLNVYYGGWVFIWNRHCTRVMIFVKFRRCQKYQSWRMTTENGNKISHLQLSRVEKQSSSMSCRS